MRAKYTIIVASEWRIPRFCVDLRSPALQLKVVHWSMAIKSFNNYYLDKWKLMRTYWRIYNNPTMLCWTAIIVLFVPHAWRGVVITWLHSTGSCEFILSKIILYGILKMDESESPSRCFSLLALHCNDKNQLNTTSLNCKPVYQHRTTPFTFLSLTWSWSCLAVFVCC